MLGTSFSNFIGYGFRRTSGELYSMLNNNEEKES
jgi:hypothetical protein